MTQSEPNPKRVSRFRWVWRGILFMVLLGLIVFIVSAKQHGRAIQQLQEMEHVEIRIGSGN